MVWHACNMSRRRGWVEHVSKNTSSIKTAVEMIKAKTTWWFKVAFLGWWSDPFKGLSDLQLGDEKVTLNHQVDRLLGCQDWSKGPAKSKLHDKTVLLTWCCLICSTLLEDVVFWTPVAMFEQQHWISCGKENYKPYKPSSYNPFAQFEHGSLYFLISFQTLGEARKWQICSTLFPDPEQCC